MEISALPPMSNLHSRERGMTEGMTRENYLHPGDRVYMTEGASMCKENISYKEVGNQDRDVSTHHPRAQHPWNNDWNNDANLHYHHEVHLSIIFVLIGDHPSIILALILAESTYPLEAPQHSKIRTRTSRPLPSIPFPSAAPTFAS